jgi:hypothetical protein
MHCIGVKISYASACGSTKPAPAMNGAAAPSGCCATTNELGFAPGPAVALSLETITEAFDATVEAIASVGAGSEAMRWQASAPTASQTAMAELAKCVNESFRRHSAGVEETHYTQVKPLSRLYQ